MTGKVVGAAVLAIVLFVPTALSQTAMITRLGGRVMEDGRPIRRIVEIRLESGTSGIVDTAYTLGGEEFEFRSVPIELSDEFFLTIQEPGYREVREEVRIGRDPFGRGVISDVGIVILYLESLPSDDVDAGPAETVDLRQLAAEISDEARDAYEAGLEHLDAGNSEESLESLELAVELAPDYYDALNKLGVEYLNLERYRDAEQMLERAYALNGNDPIPLTNLGTLHFQEGEALMQSGLTANDLNRAMASFVQSADYLAEAMRLDPASGRIAYYLGSALYKTGAYDAAEEALYFAMDNDPRMDAARLALINVYVGQQRYEAALEQIALYLEANPDTPEREALEGARSAIETSLGR